MLAVYFHWSTKFKKRNEKEKINVKKREREREVQVDRDESKDTREIDGGISCETSLRNT